MQNDWGALGLGGGVGRVDIRGATPPIGNTGPGGVEGAGLLALLRRLSMGLDEGRGPELPAQVTADPAAQSGMSNAIGGGVQGGGEMLPRGVRPRPGAGGADAGRRCRLRWGRWASRDSRRSRRSRWHRRPAAWPG